MGCISQIVALVAAATLTACHPASKPQPRKAVFNAAEYVPYERQGNGGIQGQAFLVQRNGGVVVGAGRDVYLVPVTSLTTELYERWIVGYTVLEPTDAPTKQFTKVQVGDADGRFSFTGLPAGEYYIWCTINWEVPQGYITAREGGIAHAKVKVEDGKVTQAVVTRR